MPPLRLYVWGYKSTYSGKRRVCSWIKMGLCGLTLYVSITGLHSDSVLCYLKEVKNKYIYILFWLNKQWAQSFLGGVANLFFILFLRACRKNPVNVAQYLKIQSKAGMRCFKLATASQRLRNRAAISFLTAYLLVKYFSKNCLEKLLRNAVWHHYPHCELYQPHGLTLFHTNTAGRSFLIFAILQNPTVI